MHGPLIIFEQRNYFHARDSPQSQIKHYQVWSQLTHHWVRLQAISTDCYLVAFTLEQQPEHITGCQVVFNHQHQSHCSYLYSSQCTAHSETVRELASARWLESSPDLLEGITGTCGVASNSCSRDTLGYSHRRLTHLQYGRRARLLLRCRLALVSSSAL